jgi:hypothetical protein
MSLSPEEQHKLAVGVTQGERAKALLDDPVFVAAIERVRKQYTDEVLSAEDSDIAFRSVLRVRALDDVVRQLRVTVGAGELAAHTLQRMEDGTA